MLIAFSKKTSLQLWHRLPTTPWFWMCSCFLGYHELHTSIPVSQCGPRNLYNLCLQGIWNCDTVMIAFSQDINKMRVLKQGVIEHFCSTHWIADKGRCSERIKNDRQEVYCHSDFQSHITMSKASFSFLLKLIYSIILVSGIQYIDSTGYTPFKL